MTVKSISSVCALLAFTYGATAAAAQRAGKGSLHQSLDSGAAKAEEGLTRLADNVVVTPGAPTQAAPPAVEVRPPAPQPVEVEPPRKTKVVQADVESHNYMGTLALSALGGGVLGALVGTSIYYLGDRHHAQYIGYWAAGGVLVGAGVGLIQVMVQESRASSALSSDHMPGDPAPTFRLALYRMSF